MEAATRKHEAIETDIGAYGERVAAVEAVARELEAEGYHDVRRILARRDNVLRLWGYLKELLTARRERLVAHRDLQRLLEEMRYIMDWMEDMKVPDEPHCNTLLVTSDDPWSSLLASILFFLINLRCLRYVIIILAKNGFL